MDDNEIVNILRDFQAELKNEIWEYYKIEEFNLGELKFRKWNEKQWVQQSRWLKLIDCIIFDCDGTLVDSEYINCLGLEIGLKEHGIDSCAYEMTSVFRGAKLADILKKLETKYGLKLDEYFVNKYRRTVSQLFEDKLEPCDGVTNMLEAIDLPVCVASSGPLDKIERALSVTGLSNYFGRSVFSSYEINSWKPEPDIFLHAAERMKVKPEFCAVVEDSLLGINAAISAKATPIHYASGARQKFITGAHRITHMSELNQLIDSLNTSAN